MAGKLTQRSLMQAVRSNDNVSAGDGMTVARIGQQVSIQAPQAGAIAIPGSSTFAVSFVEEFDNWVTAYRYKWSDGTPGDTLLYVAKPPHLRRDLYENRDDDDQPQNIVFPDGAEVLFEYLTKNTRK